ncbi:transposable element Tcb2 transposase [Trichonephila clavipes]|nr:transposable element Tcb2 transposase [Trichonephila clavipes]
MNATLLQQHIRSATGATVSTQTVRNWLYGVGLYARRPMSRFSVHPDNRRIFIWRAVAVGIILRSSTKVSDLTVGHIVLIANLVEDFLFEEVTVRMEWPACSPDMNPIEHVWDALGRGVAGHQPPPQTLQELERALLEEWDRIPQLVINSLIHSMPQRCSTLLAVHGNHTPY